jgi:hypothetical protein
VISLQPLVDLRLARTGNIGEDPGVELGFGFWLKMAGVIIAAGIACLVVFLLIDIAWAAWGAFGALLAVGLVLMLGAWIYDRRHARPDY